MNCLATFQSNNEWTYRNIDDACLTSINNDTLPILDVSILMHFAVNANIWLNTSGDNTCRTFQNMEIILNPVVEVILQICKLSSISIIIVDAVALYDHPYAATERATSTATSTVTNDWQSFYNLSSSQLFDSKDSKGQSLITHKMIIASKAVSNMKLFQHATAHSNNHVLNHFSTIMSLEHQLSTSVRISDYIFGKEIESPTIKAYKCNELSVIVVNFVSSLPTQILLAMRNKNERKLLEGIFQDNLPVSHGYKVLLAGLIGATTLGYLNLTHLNKLCKSANCSNLVDAVDQFLQNKDSQAKSLPISDVRSPHRTKELGNVIAHVTESSPAHMQLKKENVTSKAIANAIIVHLESSHSGHIGALQAQRVADATRELFPTLTYAAMLGDESILNILTAHIINKYDTEFSILNTRSGLNTLIGRSDAGLKGGEANAETHAIVNKVELAIHRLNIKTPLSTLIQNMDTKLTTYLKEKFPVNFPDDATILPYIKALLGRKNKFQSQQHQPSNSIQVLVCTKIKENDLICKNIVSFQDAAYYLGFVGTGSLKDNADSNASISKHVNDLYRSNALTIQDLEDAKWRPKKHTTFTHFAVFRM